ncbi:MAG: MFS transporter [Firmicutes bacterium]|nr:MFS transporter [Bacillota bacterium]
MGSRPRAAAPPPPSAEAPSPARGRGIGLGILAGVPFLMVLGNSMLFPVFAKMQAATGMSEMQTSLVVTAFSVPAGVLIPVAGYLSDRFGRRPVIAPGVALFGLGALGAGLAAAFMPSPYALILAGRAVQGMGAAAMSQLAMAMAADLFRGGGRSRAMGTIEAANGLGKAVSPVAGALAGLVAWYLPFYVFAALSLPLAAGVWWGTHEPAASGRVQAVGRYVARVRGVFAARGRSLGAGLACGGAVMFLIFGTLFYLSESLEKRWRVADIPSGLLLAVPVAALSATAYAVGLTLGRRRRLARASVLLGLALLSAVMAAMALVHDARPWVYGVVGVVGLAGGLALAALNLLVTSSAGAGERGLITSLYGGVRFFGVALGPPSFGLIMHRSAGLLFAAAAALAAAVFLVALAFLRPPALAGRDAAARRRSA